MRETIRMKMRLLDSCAKDEKDSAQDGEHESFACPVAAHSSHDYRILYAADLRFLVMALLAKDEPGTKMTNRIARVLLGGRPATPYEALRRGRCVRRLTPG
jgi:hypothetical protein